MSERRSFKMNVFPRLKIDFLRRSHRDTLALPRLGCKGKAAADPFTLVQDITRPASILARLALGLGKVSFHSRRSIALPEIRLQSK